jgi:hypothetical protein
MIRLSLIFATIISVAGCGAVTSFLVGASGNVFSDSVDRVIDKKINSSAKELPCGRSE